MITRAKWLIPFSLLLLFLFWKEAQGACSSCPSNGCSQTGAAQGKCYRARYYTTSYRSSFYVTTYYTQTSQGSSTYRCGSWFRRRRCTRYHTNYQQRSTSTLRYRISYRSNLACDAYCCTGHRQVSGGNCQIVTCSFPSTPSNGRRTYRGRNYNDRVTFSCNTGYLLRGSSSRACQANGQWSGTQTTCIRNCGTPRSLLNGRQSYSGTTDGSTVTYRCNSGYRLTAGSSRRTCQSSGLWSGSHPTCSRICSDPGTPTNGRRSLTGTTQGHSVTYTCDTGYRITGSSRRTCLSNGLWSGSPAQCPIVTCSVPSTPSNGQRTYRGRNYRYVVTFSCNTGYLLTGSSSRTCQSNGLWSGTQPTCPRSCGTPSPLPHGRIYYTSITEGNRVSFSCNSGYILSGNTFRTCQSNGRWSNTLPTCIRTCGTPSFLLYGQRSYTNTTVGSTVWYNCNAGYRLFGLSHRTCQSTGQWSGSHPTCSRNCQDPGSTTNGGRILSGTTEGHNVTYFCKVGYSLSGNQSRTCQSNGQWTGTIPVCARDCSDPGIPLNGGRNYTSTTEGSIAFYTCNKGYSLSGSLNRTCLSSGIWTGHLPTCLRDCGDPGSPEAGERIYSGTTVGNTVIYTCDSGYKMLGSFHRICLQNGQWSGSVPLCKRYCGDPGVPTSGSRNITGDTEGQVVTYTCIAGYRISGSITRSCQSNGRWSGSLPSCTRDCSDPGNTTNGQQSITDTTVGHIITYTCNMGYRMTSGTAIRRCQLNGQWTGSHPVCSRYCGDPGSTINGGRSITGTTEGHNVTYTCNTGYRLTAGSSFRRCQSSGQWSGIHPTCSRYCGTPSTIANGTRNITGYTQGHTVSYTCDNGYLLLGSVTMTCQSNGMWSGSQPSCNRNCGDPGVPKNGVGIIPGTIVGHNITYTCNSGYRLTDGSSIRSCQSNGQWSGTQPTCSRYCGDPGMATNGRRSITGYTEGHTVTYTCKTGYSLLGSTSIRTCQTDGIWTGTLPSCARDCGDPGNVANGLRTISGTTEGHRVTYSCSAGYRLVGDAVRTCMPASGQWSGTQPNCSEILPTIIGFKEPYLQVQMEEGVVSVCLVRKRNLYRVDSATVVTLQQLETEMATDSGNNSMTVTFDVGVSEACFNYSFVETMNTEQFSLMILNSTNKTEVNPGSEYVVINIVERNSPCPSAFLFPETPINSQAEVPCSLLDGSFFPGGVITARCSMHSTWDTLDMSQCTFRNDALPSAVAVVEVITDADSQKETLERAIQHLSQVKNTSQIWSPRQSQVYAIRMINETDASALMSLLQSVSSRVLSVMVAHKSDFCNCCGYSAIKVQPLFSVSASFNVCVGRSEAPQACSCSSEGLECHPRFSRMPGPPAQCFLDVDGDRIPDQKDPCIGCCLPDFDLTFQWPQTPHNSIAELPCTTIHSSFSKTSVRRRCRPDDSWEAVDMSSCTFKNTARNPIYFFTANGTMNSQENNTEAFSGMKRAVETRLNKLTEGEILGNDSYKITTQAITSSGSNSSIVLLTVEFQPTVKLAENTTSITSVTDPFNGANYNILKIFAATPSETCSCRAGTSQVAHLCVGPSIRPCTCDCFGACECIDPYVMDVKSGQCSLDTDGDNIPDYRDDCPSVHGPAVGESGGCPSNVGHSISVSCPQEYDKLWKIQWSPAPTGASQSVRCLGEGDEVGLGLAHRSCLSDGNWGPVDAIACESVSVREIRIEMENLLCAMNQTISYGLPLLAEDKATVERLTLYLQDTLNKSNGRSLLPQDLETATAFVEFVASLTMNNDLFTTMVNRQPGKVEAHIISSLLGEKNKPALELTNKSLASRMLKATEVMADAVTSSIPTDKTSVTISTPNLALHGTKLLFDKLEMHSNLLFPDDSVNLLQFSIPTLIPHIKMPTAFILATRSGEIQFGVKSVEVVNVVLRNIEDYLQEVISEVPSKEATPASLVLSSQILGYSGGDLDTNETVELTFPIKEETIMATVPTGKMKLFRCAFFNFTGGANQTGGWSYRGLTTEVINDTHVLCKASHLTSFVVLVSIVPSNDLSPLSYIIYIGTGFSFLCSIVAVIFYISLRKQLILKLHNFVHLNLCIALSLGLLLFLTGIQTATDNVVACKSVTTLLHYLFLSTFSWTLCEAVLIWNLLTKSFGVNDRKWIFIYLALGWGLPIPIVAISVALNHENYLIRHSYDEGSPYSNKSLACWLPSKTGAISAFVVPVAAYFVVNAVLLAVSLVSLARSKCRKSRLEDDASDGLVEEYLSVGKRLLQAIFIFVPVLAFTWIIALFAVGEEGSVFTYLFVISNVIQGLLLLLFYVIRHENVWWKIKAQFSKKSYTIGTGSIPNIADQLPPGTIPSTTSKLGEFDGCKRSSEVASDAGSITDECGEREQCESGQGTGMLELLSSAVDEGEKGNAYDVPYPIATTDFEEGDMGDEESPYAEVLDEPCT